MFCRCKVPVQTQSEVILAMRYDGYKAREAGIVHEVCSATDITDRAISIGTKLTGTQHHLKLDRRTTATLKHHLYRVAYTALSDNVTFTLNELKSKI